MLGIHISEGTAEGWFGPGKKSAIASLAVIAILLISAITAGILLARNVGGETSVSQPNVPIAPAPAPVPAPAPAPVPVAPKPIAPTPKPTHIIPELTQPPAPKPVAHEYVYNSTEYQIATGWNLQAAGITLRERGYNLSDEEIALFKKEHGLRKGDTALIQGKVKKVGQLSYGSYGVVLESPRLPIYCLASARSPWLAEVKEGTTITLRGTVENGFQSDMINSELVK